VRPTSSKRCTRHDRRGQKEREKAAERSFTYANEVEKVQRDLYQKALDTAASFPRARTTTCVPCVATLRKRAA